MGKNSKQIKQQLAAKASTKQQAADKTAKVVKPQEVKPVEVKKEEVKPQVINTKQEQVKKPEPKKKVDPPIDPAIPEATPEVKPVQEPDVKKQDKKEDKQPTQTKPAATPAKKSEINAAMLESFKLDPADLASTDTIMNFTAMLHNRYGNRPVNEANKAVITAMNSQIDLFCLYSCIKANMQIAQWNKQTGGTYLKINNDQIAELTNIVTAAGGRFLVSLQPGESGQLELPLDSIEMPQEMVENAKQEIKEERIAAKQAKEKALPELDPTKWTNADQVKDAICYLVSRSGVQTINVLNALESIRKFRKAQETDEKKKESWDNVILGDLFRELVEITGGKIPAIMNGSAGMMYTTAKVDNSPLFVHNLIAGQCDANLGEGAYSDEEIASYINAAVEWIGKSRNKDNKDYKLKEDPGLNGLCGITREQCLLLPADKEDSTKKYHKQFQLRFPRLLGAYENGKRLDGDGKVVDEVTYGIRYTNKAIEIANLYRKIHGLGEIRPYEEKGYPEELKKVVQPVETAAADKKK